LRLSSVKSLYPVKNFDGRHIINLGDFLSVWKVPTPLGHTFAFQSANQRGRL
jgi:hypothetical protein